MTKSKSFLLRQRLFASLRVTKNKGYPEMFFVKIKIFVAYRIITKGISDGNNKPSG